MSAPKKGAVEPALSLGDEARRRRVEAVRATARELAQIEAMLLDVQARIPTLINTVKGVRATIEKNTAAPGDETS